MTARYKPYPEYKPSDVEWIGDVPEHWWVFGGKRIFRQRIERAQVDDEQLAATQQYGVIPQSLYMKENGQKVVLALKGTDSFRHVEENDFVISLRSFQGGIEHSGYSGCVSPAYTVLDAVKQIDFRYYRYLLKSTPYICALQSSTDSLREGKSITYEQFGQISLPLLPMEEQHAIAAFLDRETGKIDRMIGKQERMIELLKEKRQAVISNAVTKGIDPTAPMKDSGIEWLGQIPEHWEATKLKYRAIFYGGGTPSKNNPDYWKGDIPWVSPKDMKSSRIGNSQDKITTLAVVESSTKLIRAGAVLMVVRSGILQRTIPVGINDIAVTLNQDMKAIIFGKPLLADFFQLLVSGLESQLLLEWRKQGATVESIEHEYLANSTLCIPPYEEMGAIIEYLKEETTKIDRLIAKAEQAIELMKERRTALISAAVTGKIDVRSVTSNAYCVTDDTPELMAAEEQAEYRVKE